MNKKPFFSIAIPFFYRDENSLRQINRCVQSIIDQTFLDYEIIISTQNFYQDLKQNQLLKSKFIKIIDAKLVGGFIQGNINNAFKFCSGEWIKILFSDDYFYSKEDLKNIYQCINTKNKKDSYWFLNNSLHCKEQSLEIINPIIPFFQERILEINTIGSPSALLIRNKDLILFDEKTWMRLDVDYYYALFIKYGKPNYISNVFVVNEMHKNQFSSLMRKKSNTTNQKLKMELNYLYKKYNVKEKNKLKILIFKIIIKIERIFLSILFLLLRKKFFKYKNLLFKLTYYKLFYIN